MAVAVIMPRQGQSVESCIISKWEKNVGDEVKTGDILFSYETDKASFEEEAKVDGTMLAIFFEEGDDVPVLTNVCVIGAPGESVDEFRPEGANTDDGSASSPEEPKAAEISDTPAEDSAQVPAASTDVISADGRIKISPRAKNLAAKEGVDFRIANPSGPNGRIIERDIQALIASGAVSTKAAYKAMMKGSPATGITGTGLGGRITTGDLAVKGAELPSTAETTATADMVGVSIPVKAGANAGYEEVKMSNIRKVIAKAMMQSLTGMAQLTLNSSFDATAIMEYRALIKSSGEKAGLSNITLNDIILYAVSRILPGHRALNANLIDDKMLYFRNVNLGMAVDTERGLMVPTIFNAELLSLNEIAASAKRLASECQKGTINPDVLKGGSFTVTNLGSLGIESFTPVINPPQTAILGVDTIVQKPREENGQIKLYPSMGLSLTFDHRAVDGAPAARFLQELKFVLENFTLLLAK